jgi:hypothetical protein
MGLRVAGSNRSDKLIHRENGRECRRLPPARRNEHGRGGDRVYEGGKPRPGRGSDERAPAFAGKPVYGVAGAAGGAARRDATERHGGAVARTLDHGHIPHPAGDQGG